MKQIIKLTAFLCLVCNMLQAQTIDSTVIQIKGRTYSRIFDSLSTGLIASRIPLGHSIF
jgi:hypothetical protein